LLDFTWWRRLSQDPASQADPLARAVAERRRTFSYFLLAFALGLVLTGFGKLRVLNAVGIDTTWYFDVVLTALILVGGADREVEPALLDVDVDDVARAYGGNRPAVESLRHDVGDAEAVGGAGEAPIGHEGHRAS